MNPSTSDAAEILDIEFGADPGYAELRAQERVKSQAAQAIYEARLAAGLTQTALARLAGTTQSVISRLEDGDYDRHSVAMLERIAAALHPASRCHRSRRLSCPGTCPDGSPRYSPIHGSSGASRAA